MNGQAAATAPDTVLRLRGLQIRMRVTGRGEPLLLLNGLTRPLESWTPFTDAVRGRRLISFDAPGVGGSPTPILPLSIPTLAALAASVLDAAGVDRADVLGFSHGGAVAQQFAVDNPERVRGLVLVSTSCGIGANSSSKGALRGVRHRTGTHSWPRPDAVGALWHTLAISGWSSIPFLGAITAPTLVVCGTHDRVVPPSNSNLLARRIPNARLRVLPAGHDLQRSGPADALADEVEEFLSAAYLRLDDAAKHAPHGAPKAPRRRTPTVPLKGARSS
jgi:poly(3-hydroxyoctanoate) depolymerase